MRTTLRLIFRSLRMLYAVIVYYIGLALSFVPLQPLRWLAHVLFRYGTREFVKCFSIKFKIVNQLTAKPGQRYLYIANHDCIFDALFLHGFRPYRTIIERGIEKFPLPKFGYYLKQYGHYLFNRHSKTDKQQARHYAEAYLVEHQQFFIFPSGGIKTKIQDRVANSIYEIAKAHDALIVPIFIEYEPKIRFCDPKSSDLELFGRLMKAKCSHLTWRYGQPLDPNDFASNIDCQNALKSLYIEQLGRP